MATHALNNKLDLVHLLVGSDGEGGQFHVDVDNEGRMALRNYVWNSSTLAWEAMEQPTLRTESLSINMDFKSSVEEVLLELRSMNIHLKAITGETITDERDSR